MRAVWAQMLAALQEEEFAPRKSRLCDWCAHRSICPAQEGGDGDVTLASFGA